MTTDPTHVRLSAAVLLGSLMAAGAGVRLHPDGAEISATAVFAAVVLFLSCLTRYHASPPSPERPASRKDRACDPR
ncbi:hypothetical protein CLV70_114164 [Pseudosporangium ferrugineum]|uniref:Uncharacterized protein n=1 Tax=Pseudosporangium ferrugineum TaxID=439699 RepID=A0A2T0RS98_9ACTN|nr:hypothetical protein CLV70_114164 [Pseudosporangium ferrugineum]